MPRRGHWATILPLILAASGAALCGASAPSPVRPSAMFPAGDATRGQALAVTCLGCHGEQAVAMGDPPASAPKLRGQRLPTIFYALLDYQTGRRAGALMTPYVAGLQEQDLRDLSTYLSGGAMLPPPKATLTDTWAHAKVGSTCGFCHGETGMGVMEGYPLLAGQYPDYIESALRGYRDDGRKDPTMQTFARGLSDDEMRQLATYYAAQKALTTLAQPSP